MISGRAQCRLGVGALNCLHSKMGEGRLVCGCVHSLAKERERVERRSGCTEGMQNGVVDVCATSSPRRQWKERSRVERCTA